MNERKRPFLKYECGDLAAPRPQPYPLGTCVVASRATLTNDRGGECVLDAAPLRVRLTGAEHDPDIGWRFTGKLFERLDLEKAQALGRTPPLEIETIKPALAQWYARQRQCFDPSVVHVVEWNIMAPSGAGSSRPAHPRIRF